MSVQATFSATLVDEWTRLGVSDAVICPGSRSTPLALALAARLRAHVRLDERSAGFYALGLAMATGRPTIVCVTSGTAAAELHPAVVEAHHARVPLIVCTADRPPELHHTGASQTIEQVGLYGAATRWAVAPGVPMAEQHATWRPLAVRAFAEAVHGPRGPGPVHLNLAFREPLTGDADPLPPRLGPSVGEPGEEVVSSAAPAPLVGRGVIVVGATTPHRLDPARVLALGDRLGWPVLADPLSGCRVTGTIGAADAIARTGPPVPECVVLLGTPWLSRALGDYVSDAASAGARVIVVDPYREWADPLRVATEFHHSPIDAWLEAAVAGRASGCEPAWLEGWRAREAGAQARHRRRARGRAQRAAGCPHALPPRGAGGRHPRHLGIHAHPRPRVVRRARGGATEGGGEPRCQRDRRCRLDLPGRRRRLVVAEGPPRDRPPRGPDLPPRRLGAGEPAGGAVHPGRRGQRRGRHLLLPAPGRALDATTFESLFGTPPTSDVVAVARGFGLDSHEAATPSDLEAALAATAPARHRGPALIRVSVPGRSQNVAVHDAINEAVRRALA